jgi:hypothetical protein
VDTPSSTTEATRHDDLGANQNHRAGRAKQLLLDTFAFGLLDNHFDAPDGDAQNKHVAERVFLWRLFRRTVGYLIALLLVAITATVALFAVVDTHGRWAELVLAIFAGTAGSAAAALLSAADRVAQGWEFDGGDQWPDDSKKERFKARMVPLFAVRPFLGSFVGALAYAGFLSGALFDSNPSSERILFITLLSGFFAKTLLDVLKGAFKGLVGR